VLDGPPVLVPDPGVPPAARTTGAAAQRSRVATSAQRLAAAARHLTPRRVGTVRRAANRLVADMKTLGGNAFPRERRTLRTLLRALTRYEHGRDRRAAARTVKRSSRTLARSLQ
jgi:hypothetical protein